MEKHKVITAVHLFLIDKSGKILLSRRYNTGYEDGKYSVVAGHVEKEETIKRAMQREALEEAGIHIELSDLQFGHVMYRKAENTRDTDRIDFFLAAHKWKGEIKIMEKDKCDAMQWFFPDDLPENIIPYVLKAIREFSGESRFSEYGWS